MRIARFAFLAFLVLACTSSRKKLDLTDGEQGTADGDYLETDSDIVIISGEADGSYVFGAEQLRDADLKTGDGEIDVFEEADEQPLCKDDNMHMDVIVVESSPALRARSVLWANWTPTCLKPERLRLRRARRIAIYYL